MQEPTVAADNEKTMLAFADWLHGYVSAVLPEEKCTACVAAVHRRSRSANQSCCGAPAQTHVEENRTRSVAAN
jgi:hypothetical protein